MKKFLDKKYYRYYGAVVVFALMMVVLFLGTKGKVGSDSKDDPMAGATKKFEVSKEDDELKTLISDYYTAYANGDVASLENICTPLSDSEKSFITFFSQYVEEYKDLKVQYKDGAAEGAYLVSAEMSIKFKDVDTAAPGLDFFYVETNEDGKLFINNLYGSYNKENGEYEMDPTIQKLIKTYEDQDDMAALSDKVTEAYNKALEDDPALDSFINQTFQEAAVAWVSQYQQEVKAAEEAAAAEQAAAEQAAAEAAAAEQAAAEAAAAEQAAAEAAAAEQAAAAAAAAQNTSNIYSKAQINVRASASTEAEQLGQIVAGKPITKVSEEGEWTKIDYNGNTGYVKSEYLTTVKSDSSERSVTLTDTVNIRTGMAEDANILRKAANGDTVTVLMDFDCGWSRVKVGEAEGFAKTDVIK